MTPENKLNLLLRETLKKANALQPAALGPGELLALGKEDKKQLLAQIEDQVRFINKIIIAIVVLHFLLFFLAAFLVFYWRDDPKVIAILLGGSVLSLMVIIRSLVSLVKTKSQMDHVLLVLPNLSAEQAIVMLQTMYFAKKKATRSARQGSRAVSGALNPPTISK